MIHLAIWILQTFRPTTRYTVFNYFWRVATQRFPLLSTDFLTRAPSFLLWLTLGCGLTLMHAIRLAMKISRTWSIGTVEISWIWRSLHQHLRPYILYGTAVGGMSTANPFDWTLSSHRLQSIAWYPLAFAACQDLAGSPISWDDVARVGIPWKGGWLLQSGLAQWLSVLGPCRSPRSSNPKLEKTKQFSFEGTIPSGYSMHTSSDQMLNTSSQESLCTSQYSHHRNP